MLPRVMAILLLGLASCALCAQEPQAVLRILPATRYQTIDGFGVNFNGTYFREAQKPAVDLLIDDLGATLFRLDPYGLTNWESINDNADPAAMNWDYYRDRYSIPAFEASWAAGRYLNSRGVVPLLALSGTVPEWMLDEAAPAKHRTCHDHPGGKVAVPRKNHLNRAMYPEFAETVVSLAVYARRDAGVKFDLFGPVNETDCYPREGPRIDPDELPAVFREIASRLKKEGMGDVKLVGAEQAVTANDYTKPIIDDQELAPSMGVFAYHTYGKDSFAENIARVKAYSQARVWLTEYGDLNDEDFTEANEWKNFSVLATRRVLDALNDGVSGAMFWDAYDNFHEHDQRMTWYGLLKNQNHKYTPKKRYYAAKHLYRFVRPGAVRVAMEGLPKGLTAAAFLDEKAGVLVIVGLKDAGTSRLTIAEPQGMKIRAWQVWETTPSKNCERTAALPGGAARLPLDAESIFTVVGEIEK